jgi:hypothetical protein
MFNDDIDDAALLQLAHELILILPPGAVRDAKQREFDELIVWSAHVETMLRALEPPPPRDVKT